MHIFLIINEHTIISQYVIPFLLCSKIVVETESTMTEDIVEKFVMIILSKHYANCISIVFKNKGNKLLAYSTPKSDTIPPLV